MLSSNFRRNRSKQICTSTTIQIVHILNTNIFPHSRSFDICDNRKRDLWTTHSLTFPSPPHTNRFINFPFVTNRSVSANRRIFSPRCRAITSLVDFVERDHNRPRDVSLYIERVFLYLIKDGLNRSFLPLCGVNWKYIRAVSWSLCGAALMR